MPRFVPITREEFRHRVDEYNWKRQVNAVHVHHTFRPNHGQWKGEESMNGMYHFHVIERGWADIAQHLTIAPDGNLWVGRDWNRPPASSVGANGSSSSGPFMFEMVGDFDQGKDILKDEQLRSVLDVTAYLLWTWDLSTKKGIRFHREFTDKTCPGSAIDKQHFLALVDESRRDNMLE